MLLVVDANGVIRCLYDESLDLTALGALTIARASHVEPDPTGEWWAELAPVGGPRLGPYARRSEAIAAERQWLEEHNMPPAVEAPF
jgi:hypothetical protein